MSDTKPDEFFLLFCNNTHIRLKPWRYDAVKQKVVGTVIQYDVTNRLFHAVNTQIDPHKKVGTEMEVPIYGTISEAQANSGYKDECYL